MATVNGTEYDHIDIKQGSTTTKHMLKDATARGDIENLKSAFEKISENKSINLLPIESLSSVVNGVNVDYQNGIITRRGTATVDGGRLIHITPTFTLATGAYVFWIATTGATLFIENASTNSIIATAVNNAVSQFELEEDTVVYIGMNVANGTTYNDSYQVQIEQGNAKTEFQPPNMLTAFDKVARESVANVNSKLETLNQFVDKSVNLLPIETKNTVVNSITCVYSDGKLTRNGTASGDGGRFTPLTDTFTLSAGTYTFWIATSGATLFIEKASDNSIVATAINNTPITFTLSNDTSVYIGMNVANGTVYNDSYDVQIERGSQKTSYQKPSFITAYDKVARDNIIQIDNELDKINGFVDTSVNCLPSARKTATVGNVDCVYEDGKITRNGTSTISGGRIIPLADYFVLEPDTYTFWSYPTGATFVLQKKSDNSIIATAINDVPETFTISSATDVYIGMTVASGVSYDDAYNIQIEKGSSKTVFEKPSYISLVDSTAREKANLSLDFDINNAFSAFMKFGVVGDSLAVGYTADGVTERNPEFSWGRILARRLGNICQLFAKAGTTTKNWFTDPYCYSELIKSENKCQAYVIGIGTNDTINASFPIGTTADINLSDSSLNADSFCGWYGKIIQTIIGVNSTAKIFVFTIPYPRVDNAKNNAIRAISELFDSVFLVDLADEYNDLFMVDAVTDFATNSHFSSGGYANLAVINNYVLSLTIKDNANDFIDIPHIPYGSATDVN